MRNYYYKLLLPFILMAISSCKDGYKARLTEMWWVVTEVKIINTNQKVRLSNNEIEFSENGICQLPRIASDNWNDNREARWTYFKEDGNSFILIKSKNIFNGKYLYYLTNDPVTIFKMTLTSDSLEIACAPAKFSNIK